MRYKWKKYNWWIYCVIIAIAVFVILYFCYPDTDNAVYILSAITQGLAAILALVFTITLVVSQMTRRYTAMDKIIFRPQTIIVMSFFGIGVVTPLLVLKFGLCRSGITLSIAITFFCVFSLMPFLKGVNDVLKYDIGIGNLNEEIMEAIELGYEPRAINKFEELNDMGKDAVKEFREDAVRKILNKLSGIGKKSAEKRFGHATSLVVEGLREIGIECIENGFDGMIPEIPEIAVMGLKDIGVAAARNGSENLSKIVADGLKDVGVKAAENRRVRTTINAVRGLKDVYMEIKTKEFFDEINKKNIIKNKNDIEIAKYTKLIVVDNIWCLGAFVTEYMPDRINLVIENLKEIKEEIDRDLLMPFEKKFIEDHPNLKSALEKFKRRYTER